MITHYDMLTGEVIEAHTTNNRYLRDISVWSRTTGHERREAKKGGEGISFWI